MTFVEHLQSWPRALRRALAVGLLLFMVISIGAATVYPLVHAARAHLAWRAEATHVLARQRALLRLRQIVATDLDALRQHALLTRLYTPSAGTPFSAQFEADVRTVLQQAGVTLFQTKSERTTSWASLSRASVAVDLTGDITLLSHLLGLVAQHNQYLEVAGLAIQVPPIADSNSNVPFSMHLVLAGYSAARDAAPTEPAPNAVAALTTEGRP